MSFSHPLARNAHVWSTGGKKGKTKRLLVVITTLQLDPDHDKYKPEQVGKLSEAAGQWVEEHAAEATDFLLMNRPKTW